MHVDHIVRIHCTYYIQCTHPYVHNTRTQHAHSSQLTWIKRITVARDYGLQIADCRLRVYCYVRIHRLTACSKIESIPGKAAVNVHRTPLRSSFFTPPKDPPKPSIINSQGPRPTNHQLLRSTNGKILLLLHLPLRYLALPYLTSLQLVTLASGCAF